MQSTPQGTDASDGHDPACLRVLLERSVRCLGHYRAYHSVVRCCPIVCFRSLATHVTSPLPASAGTVGQQKHELAKDCGVAWMGKAEASCRVRAFGDPGQADGDLAPGLLGSAWRELPKGLYVLVEGENDRRHDRWGNSFVEHQRKELIVIRCWCHSLDCKVRAGLGYVDTPERYLLRAAAVEGHHAYPLTKSLDVDRGLGVLLTHLARKLLSFIMPERINSAS